MASKQKTTENAITPQDKALSASERFTSMVMNQYSSVGTPYNFTQHEKQLIRNYFICIDQMLQKTEAERLRKNASNKDHGYDNNLPYSWQTVDLPRLAQDLAHYARIGLDMMEDNTLFPIPYRNNKGNVYGVTLMEGYNGKRYLAEKYALEPFKSVTVEAIFKNDKFRVIKKDSRNQVEGYEFDIPQPFDRGEIVGVFGYITYDDPTKNKVIVFSTADVMKRKPKYASAEFWGGTKTTGYGDKKTTIELEGWLPEMYEKTMRREVYGSKRIPRDPAKIDEHYEYISKRERQFEDDVIESEIVDNANVTPVELPATPKAIEVQEEPTQHAAADAPEISPDAGF